MPAPGHHNHSLAPGPIFGVRLSKKQLHFDAADLRTFGQRYAVEYLKMSKP